MHSLVLSGIVKANGR